MIFSLRTTSYATALFVALVLGSLLLLGSRHYRSHKNYERIIEQNEKIVFQFATIREHIAESLLEEHYRQLPDIIRELEDLNLNISQILQEQYIPDQYRMSFAGQIDLAGIILLLRGIGAGDIEKTKIRQLSQEVRILGDRLMLFDRLIVTHVKRKLIGFQSVIIGILTIILFVIIYVLVFWHRQVSMPLFSLIKQLSDMEKGKRHDLIPLRKNGEVADLTHLTRSLLIKENSTISRIENLNRIHTLKEEVCRAAWNAESKDTVFTETCKTLLTNDEYPLTWIGIPKDDNQVLPIVSDGSTTMSRQECEECMTGLFSTSEQKGVDFDAARQAMQDKRPVLLKNILANLPKGPFKNTPFSTGQTSWLALPIQHGETLYGILNIYSASLQSFSDSKIEILTVMADELGRAISALEAQKSLQIANSLSLQMASTINIMTVRLSPEGLIIDLNQETLDLLGYESKEIIGMEWASLLAPEARSTHQTLLRSLDSTEPSIDASGEMAVQTKTGDTAIICFSYASITDKNGSILEVNWIGVDVTDQKWTNHRTTRLLSIQENIFQTASDMTLGISREGIVLEANPAALAMCKMDRDTLLGSNIAKILFQESVSPAFLEALQTTVAQEFECAFPYLEGHYLVRFVPLDSLAENEDCLLVIARDISHERQLHDDTIKASRLAAMGELAIDTAHEINDISNGLINFTQILFEELSDSGATDYQSKILNNIMSEGERIAQVVQQILMFSASRSQVVESVSMEKIIEDSLSLISHQLNHDGIHAKIEFPQELPPMPVNVQKIQHVFLNLLHNARDALNQKYSHQDVNKRLEIRGETAATNGQQRLKIHVTDWGAGIHPNIVHRLFDPFFTTKTPGTGLGLSISKGLIQDHKGDIHIKSIPDSYTTVTVDLPLAS